MIPVTDEMLSAFLAAWDQENRIINESQGEYVEAGTRDRAGLAAVLALVERDYEVTATKPPGKWFYALTLRGDERHIFMPPPDEVGMPRGSFAVCGKLLSYPLYRPQPWAEQIPVCSRCAACGPSSQRAAEPVVHQLIAGDDFVHCCGRPLADVDREHSLTTLNPHGVTCRGPS